VEVTAPQTIEVVRLQGAETPDPTQSVYISVPDCTIDTFETYPDAFFSPAGKSSLCCSNVYKSNLTGTTFNGEISPAASYQPFEQTGSKMEVLIRNLQQSRQELMKFIETTMQGLMGNQDILIQMLQNTLSK